MAIKIQNTRNIESYGVKCVVYGGPGVGKTRLCATAPKPVIISAEQGLLSLRELDVDFIEINTLQDLDDAYRALVKSDYETICLDSLSEIAEVLVMEFKKQTKDGRQAYMLLADAMMPMLKRFRDIKNKNTVFTSKLIRLQDEESGSITEELLIPGKVLGYQVPYIVDELFCMQTDRKGIPFLQTSPDRTRFAKDRSGALDAKEEPNMTAIFKKIGNKK